MRRRHLIGFILMVSFLSVTSGRQVQQKLLTLDDIYDPVKRVNFSGSPPTVVAWLDEHHFLVRRTDPQTRRTHWLKVNALSGEERPFFDAARMEAAFARLPGVSADEAKRIAERPSLVMNASRTAALINFAHDLFYYEFGSDVALRLTNTPDEELEEEFSPDGRLVSFVRNFNLWVVEIATQRERPLTTDGHAKLLNGRLDWVYQEELYGRGTFKGYWWSPDSTRIAYVQLDESPVKEFVVVDHIPYYQTIETTPYPKAGTPNPIARLGVVSAAGGLTRWVDLFAYQTVEPLIVRVGWTPDSQKVVYEIQDREQTWLDLNLADPVTGASTTLFRETSPAWVEVIDLPFWLGDGTFLWLSDRSGWRHLYHYRRDGTLIRPVTSGSWEVRTLHGVASSGWVYFSGTERSPTGTDVYRIRLDGTGLERLSPSEGTHQALFNPTFTLFVDTWSDVQTPPQVRLFTAEGTQVRVIDENKVEALTEYKLSQPEFVQVKTRDGFVLEAMMIRPPDFDPKKKYPVWNEVYGGPHAPLVRNRWGGTTFLWHQMLAQKGYIIWICDNRTASGKGAQSTWPVYKNFGKLELRDLEDCLAWLKQQPYVDGSRIGITGWSFGGFMTLYALTHSRSFKIGIAGGSVTDWRDYDTIYTERYMRTPQNNPEGYEKSSPRNAAKNLQGKLLLIHGTMDDNVHLQNTLQFLYELQKAGKPVELMLYPKSRHGITDPLLLKHMRETMLRFILENL